MQQWHVPDVDIVFPFHAMSSFTIAEGDSRARSPESCRNQALEPLSHRRSPVMFNASDVPSVHKTFGRSPNHPGFPFQLAKTRSTMQTDCPRLEVDFQLMLKIGVKSEPLLPTLYRQKAVEIGGAPSLGFNCLRQKAYFPGLQFFRVFRRKIRVSDEPQEVQGKSARIRDNFVERADTPGRVL